MNKRYMKSALLFATVVVSIVLVVAFVRNKPVAVNVTTAEQNVVVEVYGLGTVEAKILSRIGFEVGAAITELNADQGDKIKKGAVLARLHSAEQEAKTALAAAAVKSAESRLKKAQAGIPKLQSTLEFHKISNKRSKALLPRGSIGEEEAEQDQMNEDVAAAELEISRNDVLLAKAELDEAQAQYDFENTLLAHHVLKAPYDALVVERHKELGTVISPGETVFTLVDPETVWVLGYVDEARAGYIHVGQPAYVRLRSLPHEKFEGKVARVDIESDRVSEERRVYVRCDVCPPRLYLGEQAEVFIQTATLENALLVPETVIDKFDGASGAVWVVQKSRLHRQPVTLGHKTLDGRVEITGGLEPEMRVVTNAPNGLREGRRVSVTKAQE